MISAKNIYEDIKYLTEDIGIRITGTEQEKQAAEYLRKRFLEYVPKCEVEEFPVTYRKIEKEELKVFLDGKDLSQIKESQVATFRRDNLGFVFQEFNLLDTFSMEDNIYLPLVLAGKSYGEMRKRLEPIAEKLGITELLKKYPYEVSGGQKQRGAVARALITNPKLILADEPTGALDSKATDELLRLFGEINRTGQTILMVTHSVKAASHASRVLFIKDGEVFHQLYRGERTNEQLYQMISDTLTMLATGGERR
mgnify:CR=1 FL=1